MEQFGHGDGRDAERLGLRVEAPTQIGRTVPEHANTQVGIQHVAQHQKASRCWCGGCTLSAISMPGRSKKSSQTALAGTTTRRAPSRRMATSWTLGGKATSFGRRNAWDRLLWNSLVRVITRPHLGYTR